MIRTLIPCLFVFSGACSGDAETTADASPTTDGDASDTQPGDDDTDCVAVSEGAWSATGSCFGHEMTTTLTLEGDGCSFIFSEWSMAMSRPDGGTVEGSDVALTGDDWADCTGLADATSIEGTCGDGCVFDMSFAG